MDCSPPGSSVHGILQARILEWAAMAFSRRFSQYRDRTCVSRLLRWQVGSLPLVPLGSPIFTLVRFNSVSNITVCVCLCVSCSDVFDITSALQMLWLV